MAPDEYIRLEKNARNRTGPYADNIGEVPPNIYILENMPLMYENRLPLEKIYNELLASDIKVDIQRIQDLMYATIYFTT